MSRAKALLSNTLIFTLSNFTSKILGFLMLPFYTTVLSKEQFGTSDLLVSLVGLLMPIFTLSISNALLRFSLDDKSNTNHAFTFALYVHLFGLSIILLLLPLINHFNVFKGYSILFFLLYLSSISQNFFNLFARGIQKVRLVGIAGIISAIVVVISNLIMLLLLDLGVEGYITSLILGQLVASCVLFFNGKMYIYFRNEPIDPNLKKEMILYSLPLIPNTLSWWVNHTANRFIINMYSGVASVGLFSAASRMPSILITFQSIFVQAWQLSAISEYDKEDKVAFFSLVYKNYNLLMLLGCSFLIAIVRPIALLIYSDSFFSAWQYTPFLLVSVVFGSMVGYYSSIYLANKKTNILFVSTLTGGIVTIIGNLILVPAIGIMGSAISNTISYIVVWLYLHLDSARFLKLNINYLKNYIEYSILVLEAIYVTFYQINMISLVPFILFAVLIIMNALNLSDLYLYIYSSLIKLRSNHVKKDISKPA